METVVFDKPEVKLDAVEAVGSDKIFFNWTIVDWNAPVTDYFLSVSLLKHFIRLFSLLGLLHTRHFRAPYCDKKIL